jgi:hypothetical protein
MVQDDGADLNRRSTDVLIDVTSIIGAEEFITAQNRAAAPRDPFARQCFVEVVQSLIFMSRVYVAHPVEPQPAAADFGARPRLLQELVSAGLLHLLQLDPSEVDAAQRAEGAAVEDLQSWQGNRSLATFIEQALACDDALAGTRNSLAARMWGWATFQAANVRQADDHHLARVTTSDGIEDDAFGEWGRAAGVVLRGPLQQLVPAGEEPHVAAALARGMKYQARAAAAAVSYQSHPMRRDFLLTFDLTRDGAEESLVFEVIKAVRGVQAHLTAAGGEVESHRLQLLELELPLLGGRLWRFDETGRMDDERWVALVVRRIADYRERSADLRQAIERCVTDEDYLRLMRDIDEAKKDLAERLGLRRPEPSAVEREIVNGVASVVEAVPGVPKVSGLWFGTKPLRRTVTGGRNPVQRFLYREFMHAWRRARR